MLPAQRICTPPHLVITGTDHLPIHPVGYYVVGQSTHQNLKLCLCVFIQTPASLGEKKTDGLKNSVMKRTAYRQRDKVEGNAEN